IVLVYCLYNKKTKFNLIFITAIIVNILLDLSVGAKYSLIYQIFFMGGMLIYLISRREVALSKVILFFILSLGVVSIYKYINYVRFGLLSGASLTEAILMSKSIVSNRDIGALDEIINRINGIDHVIFSKISSY